MPKHDERWYRNELANRLRGWGWSIQQHEDRDDTGIPDWSFGANYVDGWIEVKYASSIPSSLSAIKHYTSKQRQWLTERGAAGGGHCYLLVGTPDIHVLWKCHALGKVLKMPWHEAINYATGLADGIPTLARLMDEKIRLRSG